MRGTSRRSRPLTRMSFGIAAKLPSPAGGEGTIICRCEPGNLEIPGLRFAHPGMTTLPRPQRAVLAHHLHQHALAQATIGNAQPRQRKGFSDRVQYSATGKDKVSALGADTVIGGALGIAHAKEARNGCGDLRIVKPDSIHPASI